MSLRKGAEPGQAILIVVLGLVSFSIIFFGVISLICGTVVSFSNIVGQEVLCRIPHFGTVFKDSSFDGNVFGLNLTKTSLVDLGDTKKYTVTFDLNNLILGEEVGAGTCRTNLKCFVNRVVVQSYDMVYSGTYECVMDRVIELSENVEDRDEVFGDAGGDEVSISITASGVFSCPYSRNGAGVRLDILPEEDNLLFNPINYMVSSITEGNVLFKAIDNDNTPRTDILILGGTKNPKIKKILVSAPIDPIVDWGCSDYVCTKTISFSQLPYSEVCLDTFSAYVNVVDGELYDLDNARVVSESSVPVTRDYNMYDSTKELELLGIGDNSVFQMFGINNGVTINGFVYQSDQELDIKMYKHTVSGFSEITSSLTSSLIPSTNVWYVELDDAITLLSSDTLFLGVKGSSYSLGRGFLSNNKIEFAGSKSLDINLNEFGGSIVDPSTVEYYIYPVLDGEFFEMKFKLFAPFSYNKINTITPPSGVVESILTVEGVTVSPPFILQKENVDIIMKINNSQTFLKLYHLPLDTFSNSYGVYKNDRLFPVSPSLTFGVTHNASFGCYSFRIKDDASGNFGSILDELSYLEEWNLKGVFRIVASEEEASFVDEYGGANTLCVKDISLPSNCEAIDYSVEFNSLFGYEPPQNENICGDWQNRKAFIGKDITTLGEEEKREVAALILWATGYGV